MKFFLLLFIYLFLLFIQFESINSFQRVTNQIQINQPVVNREYSYDDDNSQFELESISIDGCVICVDFLNDYLPDIIKIVGDYGIIDSCSKICTLLNKTVEIDICKDLCDAIGVGSFWKIFLLDDINPIYACQLVKACTVSKYPAVNLISSEASPHDGNAGDLFHFNANFTVINSTGVGQFAYIVYYKNQAEYLYTQLFANYEPGTYQITLPFQTVKNETFVNGVYPVDFMMCASACSSHTPYSVNLNQSEFSFKLISGPTPPPTITPTPTDQPSSSTSHSSSDQESSSSKANSSSDQEPSNSSSSEPESSSSSSHSESSNSSSDTSLNSSSDSLSSSSSSSSFDSSASSISGSSGIIINIIN